MPKKTQDYETFNKLFMGAILVGLVYITFYKKPERPVKQMNSYDSKFYKCNKNKSSSHYVNGSQYSSYHFNSKENLRREFKSINVDELDETQLKEWYVTLKENNLI